MKWTDAHDVVLCRELLLMKPYRFKPGTKDSGSAWTAVASDLNSITEVNFNVNQKGVRDRSKLLIDKFKRRMREEENSSGTVQEPTEIDNLLEEIKSESEVAAEQFDTMNQNKQKQVEKARENAEQVRTVAMENLSETNKRKSLDISPTSSKKRNTGSETLSYLMAKLESDKELKKQELEMKRLQIENERNQQNTFNALLEQQRQMQINQQQQNELVLRLMETIAKK